MSQSPLSLQMVFSNVIFDVIISRLSLVFGQSRANVGSLAAQHFILYIASCLWRGSRCTFPQDARRQTVRPRELVSV